ncbi:3-dehydroquinate synthase [Tribonema minus]|uniref:3-dehydroquinate synthase n=1 Tax=Tribonema minus TaxID=303371 RepID=A0A836CH94_9STRA|nr:3-dehydroquinate synthase [Tribonema minus]
MELVPAALTSVAPAGVGDRVCLDLVQLLRTGEGVLVGSSAKLLALVHAETLETGFVPARPFRVNAGPVHAYVRMADGSTKYLSEVRAGDQVLVVGPRPASTLTSTAETPQSWPVRAVTVGRCKIEPRPLLMVSFDAGGAEGQLFLQQAETVRLVSGDGGGGGAVSVTNLGQGDVVLVQRSARGTHVGRAISARVTEL